MNTRCRRWTRWVLASTAPLLVAGGLAAHTPKAPSSGITLEADVPLVESEGMPCVNAVIGDGPELLFGIDTGNGNTTLGSQVAKSAGLAVSALPPPAPPRYFLAVLPPLRVGAVALAGAHAAVFDFGVEACHPGFFSGERRDPIPTHRINPWTKNRIIPTPLT